MKKLIFIFILIGNLLISKDSSIEIFTESYSGTKEGYQKSIEGFITFDSQLHIQIDNDSIVNRFEALMSKIDIRNKFYPSQTKTIIILFKGCQRDTLILNRMDSKKNEFKEIIELTDEFFPINYKIW
ncbi:MAG: hypothetical protein WC121_06700 [Candidatus Kapaibacterium sp.]